ncbi:MAG: leucine-rich repeat domain-containing protein, partial [Methanomassiliicoccaceae archaeon]|nr:leucine-rich repeat domain-containing protein [Methanomassiliicoccaceae archaeon]
MKKIKTDNSEMRAHGRSAVLVLTIAVMLTVTAFAFVSLLPSADNENDATLGYVGERFDIDNLRYEILTEPQNGVTDYGTVVLMGPVSGANGSDIHPQITVTRATVVYRVTEIAASAFENTSNGYPHFNIADFSGGYIEKIGNNAFKGCTGLQIVDFTGCPVTYIGSGAFEMKGNPDLTTIIFTGDDPITIGSNAFSGLKNLQSVSLPAGTVITGTGLPGTVTLVYVDGPGYATGSRAAGNVTINFNITDTENKYGIRIGTTQGGAQLFEDELAGPSLSMTFGNPSNASTFYITLINLTHSVSIVNTSADGYYEYSTDGGVTWDSFVNDEAKISKGDTMWINGVPMNIYDHEFAWGDANTGYFVNGEGYLVVEYSDALAGNVLSLEEGSFVQIEYAVTIVVDDDGYDAADLGYYLLDDGAISGSLIAITDNAIGGLRFGDMIMIVLDSEDPSGIVFICSYGIADAGTEGFTIVIDENVKNREVIINGAFGYPIKFAAGEGYQFGTENGYEFTDVNGNIFAPAKMSDPVIFYVTLDEAYSRSVLAVSADTLAEPLEGVVNDNVYTYSLDAQGCPVTVTVGTLAKNTYDLSFTVTGEENGEASVVTDEMPAITDGVLIYSFEHGTEITLSITPDTDNMFILFVGGEEIWTDEPEEGQPHIYTFFLYGDIEVSVEFVRGHSVSLVTENGDHGSLEYSYDGVEWAPIYGGEGRTVYQGEDLFIKVTASEGYMFLYGINDDGYAAVGLDGNVITLTPSWDVILTISFIKIQTVSVLINGEEGAVLYFDGNEGEFIPIADGWSGIFGYGDEVMMKIVASEGHEFTLIGTDADIDGNGVFTFIVTDDAVLTVEFTVKVFTVTVIIDGEGGDVLYFDENEEEFVPIVSGAGFAIGYNGTITFSIEPYTGFTFSVDGLRAKATGTIILNVTDDTDLTVTFIELYEVTFPDAPENYTIEAYDGQEMNVVSGGDFMFTVEADEGYTVGTVIYTIDDGTEEFEAEFDNELEVYVIRNITGDIQIFVNILTNISFVADQNGGSVGVSTTVSITVNFCKDVTGFDENAVKITFGSGSATVVSVTGSGDTYVITLTDVTEGKILLTISDFDHYKVIGNSTVVDVYEDLRTEVSFIAEQNGGSAG